MRIESVTAHAFGPFAGETLELASGMTVVSGLNESGKSTWHAAIYAALCGRRRGRGSSTQADRDFAARHRPWDAEGWRVTAVVVRDGERRIELSQDLDGLVDCRAVDLANGRDVSAEIVFEGSPDASRWLGLDRHSFLSTACVRQAELLAVREGAHGLQDLLQRAAAASGSESAADAIRRIERFRRDHVGRDRQGAVRPLRRAIEGLAEVERTRRRARDEHDDYVRVGERVQTARRAAGVAANRAERATARVEALRDLVTALDGARRAELEHERSEERAYEAAGRAGRAADAVRRAKTLAGRVAELDRLLPLPPEVPADGDLAVAPEITKRLAAWQQAVAVLAAHEREAVSGRPAAGQAAGAELAAATAFGPVALRELAARLDAAPPVARADALVDDLADQLADAQSDLRQAEESVEAARLRARDTQAAARSGSADPARRAVIFGAAAGFAAAAAAVLFVIGVPAAGGAVLAVAVVLGVIALLGHQRSSAEDPNSSAATEWALAVVEDAQRRLSVAERQVAQLAGRADAAAEAARSARAERELITAACAAAGLRADAAELRALASAVESQMARARWVALASDRRRAVDDAEGRLRRELSAAGVDAPDEPVLELVARYQGHCEARLTAAESAQARDEAAGQLSDALDGVTLEQLADRARRAAVESDSARGAADMARTAAAAARATASQRAAAAAVELGAVEPAAMELTAVELGANAPELLVAAQREFSAARADRERLDSEADRLEAAWIEQAKHVGPVADAEEALEAARAELGRVEGLAQTLETTIELLRRAQDRVHRDVAPVLQRELRPWLPQVTSGRYADVLVDPETLQVRVCGPSRRWRDADVLSVGTAEQVYLLLRVALAARLTSPDEACPILLDDVTVQSDPQRTEALLNLLHELSADRQVVLFAASEQVDRWAAGSLTGPRDAVVRLADPRPDAA